MPCKPHSHARHGQLVGGHGGEHSNAFQPLELHSTSNPPGYEELCTMAGGKQTGQCAESSHRAQATAWLAFTPSYSKEREQQFQKPLSGSHLSRRLLSKKPHCVLTTRPWAECEVQVCGCNQGPCCTSCTCCAEKVGLPGHWGGQGCQKWHNWMCGLLRLPAETPQVH